MSDLLERLRAREGGWETAPADRRGLTNFGITLPTLSSWLGRPAGASELKALTWDAARAIYQARYLDGPGISRLPEGIQDQMLDFAVNSGPALAISALQECLHITKDGVVCPATIAAATLASSPSINIKLAKWRCMMVARIIQRDPSQRVFLAGWLVRFLSFIPEV